MNEKELSRREFLGLAAVGAGVLAVSGDYVFAQEILKDKTLRLNPAFRINEISGNEIELFTQTGDGKFLKHRFTDLDADIFRVIAKGEKIETMIQSLAQKYHLSEDVCQQKISQSLKEFEEAKLVYYGKEMLVKISEARVENVR